MNKAQIDIDVKRLGPGKYLFGTRNIMCKIINGKLVVRVGGGYMSADEFIEQYGKIELLKAMKEAGNPDFEDARKSLANVADAKRSGSNPRASAVVNIGDMKDLMRKQLDAAKVYEDAPRMDNSGAAARAGSNKRPTVAQVTGKSPTNQGSPMGSPKGTRQGSAGRGR